MVPFSKKGNYAITATFSGANYEGSGYGLGCSHTYTIKIIDGIISCSELNKKFTGSTSVTWAVKSDSKDITTIKLESLSIKEI